MITKLNSRNTLIQQRIYDVSIAYEKVRLHEDYMLT